MADARLIPENLDDRNWQEIVDQAVSLIPRYAPEWTDHSPSDLGITLVELFAWIVEGMIYRLNRVPERTFVEFLDLLGVTREPATPATARLTYTVAPGFPPTTVPRGSRAATQQLDDEPPIVFQTDANLLVLATNLTHALSIRPGGIIATQKYWNVTEELVAAPLGGLTITVPPNNGWMLVALGFDAAVAQPLGLDLRLRVPATAGGLTVGWSYSTAGNQPTGWSTIPLVVDGTQGLSSNGRVQLTVPANWTAQDPTSWGLPQPASLAEEVAVSRSWVGLRLDNPGPTAQRLELSHVLFNSVEATNALTIDAPELLGTSTGGPFQAFALRNAPLYEAPATPEPYAHLVVEVREPVTLGELGPWTPWTRVDEFEEGAGRGYRLDPVLGRIEFGSHDSSVSPEGHGTIPPLGSEVRAATYRYVGGGANGNLPPATIVVPQTPIAGVTAVTNHGPAQGGSDQQTVEDAKRRGPEVLRIRDRAVTPEDYESLARRATTDVVKVRALEPRLFDASDQIPPGLSVGDPWTFGGLNRSPGVVNLIVVPDAAVTVPTPAPSPELVREVQDHLTPRRSLASALTVTGPRYLPIHVRLDVMIFQQAVSLGLVQDPTTSAQVVIDLDALVRRYLHPTRGGASGEGWEIGEAVTIAGLFDFVKPDSRVGFISNLQLTAQTPLYTPTTRPLPTAPAGVWVRLADYELTCSAAGHSITATKV